MNCALVNLSTGLVENLIVAEAGMPVDEGYVLVPDYPAFVAIGMPWNGSFVDPNAGKTSPAQIDGVDTL